MEAEKGSKAGSPRPAVAGLLSLLVPGMGQVCLGAVRRGLGFAAVVVLAILVAGWMITRPTGVAAMLILAAAIALCLHVSAAIDAAMVARRAPGSSAGMGRRVRQCALFWLGLMVATSLETAAIRAYRAQAFRMPTSSMEPTLLAGDYFFADKRAYRQREPRRGELVVFRHPGDRGRSYVKRLVGLPGDTVEVRNCVLWLNGERLTSDPLPVDEAQAEGSRWPIRREIMNGTTYFVLERPAPNSKPMTQEAIRVPDGEYYFLGDNRNNSMDSRYWGSVERDALIGPVTHTYYSHDKEAGRVRWSRIGRVFTVDVQGDPGLHRTR